MSRKTQRRDARLWALFERASVRQAQDWTERLGGLASRLVGRLALRALLEQRPDMLLKLSGQVADRLADADVMDGFVPSDPVQTPPPPPAPVSMPRPVVWVPNARPARRPVLVRRLCRTGRPAVRSTDHAPAPWWRCPPAERPRRKRRPTNRPGPAGLA